MNIIKNWYFKWLAYTGRLNVTNMHLLCVAMNDGAENEKKSVLAPDYYNGQEFSWKLDGWVPGKMSKVEVFTLLNIYFRHNVPSRETQFKLLECEGAAYIYLQELGRRKKPWARMEEEILLEMPKHWWKQLRKPLDDDYVCLLLDTEDYDQLSDYLHRFKMGTKGEKYLVQKVEENDEEKREKCNFHELACDYVLMHSGEVFTSKEVQLALVKARNCDDLLKAVVGQASMGRPYLTDTAIEWLIFAHREALNLFLAQSYIANPDMLAGLLKQPLTIAQKHLLYISQLKQIIYQQFRVDCEIGEEPAVLQLTAEEQGIIAINGPLKRFRAVQEKILPRLLTGEVSPAMASWLVLHYSLPQQVLADDFLQDNKVTLCDCYPTPVQMMTQAVIDVMLYMQRLMRKADMMPLVLNNGSPFVM